MGESMDWSNSGDFTSVVVLATNGGLCGNGDMSMASEAGAGEDDGSGGVVIACSAWMHEQLRGSKEMKERRLKRDYGTRVSYHDHFRVQTG